MPDACTCLASGTDGCVITVSSGLINFLEEDEFEFVAGHELGHFLLGHTQSSKYKRMSPEYLMRCRSQEISVDRVGLHACNSLDTAIRALMKIMSGLSAPHLRFDVAAFISQLKSFHQETADQSASTHPSMLIRSKALLWYSLSDYFLKGEQFHSVHQIRTIDERIERDLTRFVDGIIRRRIEQKKRDVLLWMLAQEIVQHGMFSKAAQSEMADVFGVDTVRKLKSFLAESSSASIEITVHERVMESRQELESLIPDAFMSEIRILEKIVQKRKDSIISEDASAS